MRNIALIMALTALASCGGGRATGPIGSACSASDRSAANARLCSCIQRVASDKLSLSDQRRAAPFFTDPDRAQETRARTDSASDAFWRRYKSFADSAAARCG